MILSPESGFGLLILIVTLIVIVLGCTPLLERWITANMRSYQRTHQARKIRR